MENVQPVGSIKTEKAKSISHALSILNEAAKDSSDEIRHMVNRDYHKLKETFAELKPEVGGALRELGQASGESIVRMKNRAVDFSKDAARTVDRSAHENPWYFIGAAAALATVIGFVFGRKIRTRVE